MATKPESDTIKKSPRPKCAGCYSRAPRWPTDEPRFCTQKCAALWAVDMIEGQVWNPDQGAWVETW